MLEIDYDDIDAGTREHIRTLNDAGYETYASCSGLICDHVSEPYEGYFSPTPYLSFRLNALPDAVAIELIENDLYIDFEDYVTHADGSILDVGPFIIIGPDTDILVEEWGYERVAEFQENREDVDSWLIEKWDKMLEILLSASKTRTPYSEGRASVGKIEG